MSEIFHKINETDLVCIENFVKRLNDKYIQYSKYSEGKIEKLGAEIIIDLDMISGYISNLIEGNGEWEENPTSKESTENRFKE